MDPTGEIPILLIAARAFIIGVAADIATSIAIDMMFNGKSFDESFNDLNYWSAGVSGITGAAGYTTVKTIFRLKYGLRSYKAAGTATLIPKVSKTGDLSFLPATEMVKKEVQKKLFLIQPKRRPQLVYLQLLKKQPSLVIKRTAKNE